MYIKMVVVGNNASDEPGIHTCVIEATQEQVRNGAHYRLATNDAIMNGFSGDMVAFDPTDLGARAEKVRGTAGWLSDAALRVGSIDDVRKQVENGLAYLRSIVEEPVLIRYDEHVRLEVRPDNDDERILVHHEEMGNTVVNYTSEGVILDVYGADESRLDSLYTMSVPMDELVTVEEEQTAS